MKRALFVVSDLGQGHRVRCGALADELRARGWECETWSAGTSDRTDASVVIQDIGDLEPEPYICKIGTREVWIRDVPQKNGFTICDLLVCGGAWATPEAFKDSGAKRVLAGPAYALLRPEFAKFHDGKSMKVGVFDSRKIEGWSAGPIALSMLHSSITIAYAGMRALEAACVGAPEVLVSRNEGERLNQAALWKAGAAYWWEEFDIENANTKMELERLLANHDQLAKMSAAGRAMVDGLGCKRVADAIEEML